MSRIKLIFFVSFFVRKGDLPERTQSKDESRTRKTREKRIFSGPKRSQSKYPADPASRLRAGALRLDRGREYYDRAVEYIPLHKIK